MSEAIAEDMVRDAFRRWSALEDEKDAISADLKEMAKEWKGAGLNTKAMRAAFRRKRKIDSDPAAVQAEEAEVDLYLACLDGHRPVPRDPRVRTREIIEEIPPAHDPETPAAAPEPVAAEVESREAEAVGAATAEASAESSDDGPLTVASAGPNSGSHPITRQLAAFGEGGRIVGGERSMPRGPIRYPLDANGCEDPGDPPASLRRA